MTSCYLLRHCDITTDKMKAQRIFEKTYNKHIEKIFRFIFLKLDSKESAEDLTSETFSRYWRALCAKTKIDNHSAFLYRIAKNLIADYYRKKSKVQFASVQNENYDFIIDSHIDLAKRAIINSDIQEVKAKLCNVNENYQDIIIWHYLEEFSIKEIAGILGKSEATTRVLLHRAMQSLKIECSVSDAERHQEV